MGDATKACRVCGATKPLDEFHRQSKAKDGRQSRCKPCAIAMARKWYEDNRERALAQQADYRLEHADEKRARDRAYYVANKIKWEQRYAEKGDEIRAAQRKRGKAWRSVNADRKREADRRFYDVNAETVKARIRKREQRLKGDPVFMRTRNNSTARRRARKAAGDVRLVLDRDWRRMLERHRYRCAYCGGSGRLTQEHVVPIARGGRHAIGNLLPVCGPCNSSKGAKLLAEWRRHRRASAVA